MTDDLMVPLTGPNLGAPGPRRHARHVWVRVMPSGGLTVPLGFGSPVEDWPSKCSRCGIERDAARSRRGRTNRTRGNAIERWVNGLLGIANRGKFGGPDDGGGQSDWITVQTKSGTAYPERIDALLRALPATAGQLRGVVHTDAPGPGKTRRALITIDLREFADWYGGTRE